MIDLPRVEKFDIQASAPGDVLLISAQDQIRRVQSFGIVLRSGVGAATVLTMEDDGESGPELTVGHIDGFSDTELLKLTDARLQVAPKDVTAWRFKNAAEAGVGALLYEAGRWFVKARPSHDFDPRRGPFYVDMQELAPASLPSRSVPVYAEWSMMLITPSQPAQAPHPVWAFPHAPTEARNRRRVRRISSMSQRHAGILGHRA